MADLKISQLPLAVTLTGAEAWPVVQSGVTVQAKVSNITDYLSSAFLPVGIVSTTELGYLAGVTGPLQQQFKDLQNNLYWKEACHVSTTEETPLSDFRTIDGVFVNDGMRVLVQYQSDKGKNGIYVVQPGDWKRANDFDHGVRHIGGSVVSIVEGNTHKDKAYICTSNSETQIDDGTEITFALFGGKEYFGAGGQITIGEDNTIGIDAEVFASFLPVNTSLNTVLANGSDTGSNDITFSNQTADRVTVLDGSQKLVSSDVTSAELSALAGVSGTIQPQINALANSVEELKLTGDWKNACRVSTTMSIDLAGFQNIDGVDVMHNDRVLVQFQDEPQFNGIYIAQPGEWIRATDFNEEQNAFGAAVVAIQEGDTYKNKGFICTNTDPVNVGGDEISFALFGGKEYFGAGGQIVISGDNTISLDAAVYSSFLPASASLATVLANGSTTGSNDITFANQTADKVTVLNSSKKLISSAVTTSELNQLAGVTSPVQSQLTLALNLVDEVRNKSVWKLSCVAATTGPVSLSGLSPVDGVSITMGSKVLVRAQTAAKDNGIYYVRPTGGWIRNEDFYTDANNIAGCIVHVTGGTTYRNKTFICTTAGPVTVGTTPITFDFYNAYSGTTNQITVSGNVIGISSAYAGNFLPANATLTNVLTNGSSTGSNDITFTNQTADRVAYFDSSKKLVSGTVTPTELTYVSGVTSSVQGQINGLAGSVSSLASTVSSLGSEAKYWKDACLVSTTANIDLNGHQDIDGVDVEDDMRVLVQFQDAIEQNGIYMTSGGAWTRAEDFDEDTDHVAGAVVAIQSGDTYKNKLFICSNSEPVDVGGMPISFVAVGGSDAIEYMGSPGQITITGSMITVDPSYAPALSSYLIGVGDGTNKLSSSNNLSFNGTELYVNGSLQSENLVNFSGNILQADGSGSVTGSSDLTFQSGQLVVNGDIQANGLSGTDERLVKVDSSGKLTAGTPTIEQWISNTEIMDRLESDANWESGNYIGPELSETYQSQTHFGSQYFYICTSDDNWIRMQRV